MKKVILLASKDMCDILQNALNDKFITLPCSDPVIGASLLRSNLDALIVELSMLGANGLTFLRTHIYNLPPIILVITPFINLPILQELTSLGVSAVFLIPCKMSYFADSLAEYLT